MQAWVDIDQAEAHPRAVARRKRAREDTREEFDLTLDEPPPVATARAAARATAATTTTDALPAAAVAASALALAPVATAAAAAPRATAATAASDVLAVSSRGASGFAIDLCDDDTDAEGSLFASSLNVLFDEDDFDLDDIMELADLGEAADPVPPQVGRSKSIGSSSSGGGGGGGGGGSGSGSGAPIAPIVLDDDDDNDDDNADPDAAMAARLQTQLDAEEHAEQVRRVRRAAEDERLARRVQEQLAAGLEPSAAAAEPHDLLRAQRARVREWLSDKAKELHVKEVWSNPSAQPGGLLYERFAAAFKAASDKAVRLVFHGTRAENIDQICTHGLDPTRRGLNGQALGAGEYFAETPAISIPYCAGSKRMLVFAVLMDRSGLTKRQQGIVVINKSEHQLPLFVITFEQRALEMLRTMPPQLGNAAPAGMPSRLGSAWAQRAAGAAPAGMPPQLGSAWAQLFPQLATSGMLSSFGLASMPMPPSASAPAPPPYRTRGSKANVAPARRSR